MISRLVRFFISIFLLLTIWGCQEKRELPKGVTLALTTNRTDKANTTLKALAREYEIANPHVTIQIEAIKNVQEVLSIRACAGELRDITLFSSQTPQNLYPELLYPLDSLNINPEEQYFYDFGIGSDGKLYSIVSAVNYVGVIYHKGAFQKAEIERPPRDWESFLTACQDLKDQDIQPMAINYHQGWPLTPYIEHLPAILTGDAYILEKSLNHELFPSDGIKREIFGKLRTLYDNGFLEENLLLTDWELMKQKHSKGEIGMTFLASWYSPQLADLGTPKADIGFFPFPDSQAILVNSGYSVGIGKNTSSPEESLKLFKYLFLEGNYQKAVNVIPAQKTTPPDIPGMEEFLSYPLPHLEDHQESEDYRERLRAKNIDLTSVLQEYLISPDPDSVLEKYNRIWKEN